MSGGLAVSATAPDGSASAASRKAALEYLDLGYALLPLKGKTPHYQVLKSVYGGTEWAHLRRPTSPTEVEEWLAVDPSLDIGIQTGRVSNNLVVVDFDRRGGEDLIPSTPVVKTTRGLHLYVEGDQTVASQRCTHGEIRADGLYVAAPPSIHPSGARYEWLRHPNEVALLPVAELDEQLVRLLTSGAEADGQGTSPSADTPRVHVLGKVLKARCPTSPAGTPMRRSSGATATYSRSLSARDSAASSQDTRSPTPRLRFTASR